jgi:lipopolysaccharide heptosyltransferase II
MFEHLQIYDRRDRRLVGAADLALRWVAPALRVGRGAPAQPPRRILLLRLERIGDLLMTLEAIEDVRQAAPGARIDLVVGSWNLELAAGIRGIARVEALDAAWLSRDGGGLPLAALLRRARGWSARQYDLAINFEPDIRSNMILAASRAPRLAGFASGGGGALLDVSLPYQPRAHTAVNAQRLVAAVLDVPTRTDAARLEIPPAAARAAAGRLSERPRPFVGLHVSGGRAVKQWPPERFAQLAGRVARARGGTIVLTGSQADRPLVAQVAAALEGVSMVDVAGDLDLAALAALLERLDLLVTGDTGPMHLAAAVGTPVVAVFGPSDPVRYAPQEAPHQIVRIDLPCSPCNRIRLPPARCVGHTPDCLAGVDVERVYRAVETALDRTRTPPVQPALARG